MTPFERRVLAIVSRIPVGRVTTYGDIARLAVKPGAARAVGNIMRRVIGLDCPTTGSSPRAVGWAAIRACI